MSEIAIESVIIPRTMNLGPLQTLSCSSNRLVATSSAVGMGRFCRRGRESFQDPTGLCAGVRGLGGPESEDDRGGAESEDEQGGAEDVQVHEEEHEDVLPSTVHVLLLVLV